MARSILLLTAAALIALGPAAASAGDRYGPQVSDADEAYAYRRAEASGERYSYERRETGGYGYADESAWADDGYGYRDGRASADGDRDDYRYENGRGYEEGYRYEAGYDDRYEEGRYEEERWVDDRRDGHRGPKRKCQPRHDDRGRAIETCGEVRLSDSFFWGGGGVGPEYIDAGGGGGGGFAYAGAGASASAYASARASVGVSIRIGGKRGHGGKPGHPPKGGGCCKKH
ncbi:MAG TPA: hypothetical protein VEA44_03160 [Caulobacter sp.]|nr:hypothetical protein [Caulobacter sp.]